MIVSELDHLLWYYDILSHFQKFRLTPKSESNDLRFRLICLGSVFWRGKLNGLFWFGFVCRFDDLEVQRDIKFFPYKIVNKDGKPYIQVKVKGETKVFSPEEISAMILGKMKETAEAYLGKKIKDAVVTVPGIYIVS